MRNAFMFAFRPPEFDVNDYADYDAIFGPIRPGEAETLRAANPAIKLYSYTLLRYLQPWMEADWERHCRMNHLDRKIIYFRREQMSDEVIRANDAASPWPIINLKNVDVRYWLLYELWRPRIDYLDGAMIDHPMLTGPWQPCVDSDNRLVLEYDYKMANHAVLCNMRTICGGKRMFPNFGTKWWIDRLIPLSTEAIAACGGLYLEGRAHHFHDRDIVIVGGGNHDDFYELTREVDIRGT